MSIKTTDKEKIFQADLANIVRKVKAGKPLTVTERKVIEDQAEDTPETVTATTTGELFTQYGTKLAKALGLNRDTVAQHKDRPDHPKKIAGKGWNIQECRIWYMQQGILRPSGTAVDRLALAQARKEEARAKILEIKAKKDEGKLIPIEDITDSFSDIAGEAMSKLRAVAVTAGAVASREFSLSKEVSDRVEQIIRGAIDDSLSELSKLPWLTDEKKKQLQSLGQNSLQQSVAFFVQPLTTERCNGPATTSNSTAPILVPDLSG